MKATRVLHAVAPMPGATMEERSQFSGRIHGVTKGL